MFFTPTQEQVIFERFLSALQINEPWAVEGVRAIISKGLNDAVPVNLPAEAFNLASEVERLTCERNAAREDLNALRRSGTNAGAAGGPDLSADSIEAVHRQRDEREVLTDRILAAARNGEQCAVSTLQSLVFSTLESDQLTNEVNRTNQELAVRRIVLFTKDAHRDDKP
jgi:outer membrane murein-binding lipoprotein Lpp